MRQAHSITDMQIASSSQRIKILPEELANKIAAGEVVERPASVVKELVENSLDAGATQITIDLKQSGFAEIRVTDDGSGMNREDALLALQRHATSKITSLDDLTRITTLGFRGEALPSIAAVSLLELTTCAGEGTGGTRLVCEAGKVTKVSDIGAPQGTTVTVRELFFNTPARRKFQKSPMAEIRQISEVVTQIALGNSGVAFALTNDGRELLKVPGKQTTVDRLGRLFGKGWAAQLVPLSENLEGVRLDGFAGKPDFSKSNRAQLYLFVNRRPIQSRLLYHAVAAGYGELLPRGRFPVAVVFLTIDPELVDVNVHPTKNEVRFASDRLLHSLLYSAVSRVMQAGGGEKQFATPAVREQSVIPQPLPELVLTGTLSLPVQPDERKSALAAEKAAPLPLPDSRQRLESPAPPSPATLESSEKVSAPLESSQVTADHKPESGTFYQFANVYIISQVKGSLVVVDQHTAHERVLYEEALRMFAASGAHSQQLLFPISLELSPVEYATFTENQDVLAKLGFELQPFGDRTVLIAGMPMLVREKNPEKFLREVLDDLAENLKAGGDRLKAVAQSYACKAAVKAGDKLTPEEMSALFDQLFATRNPYVCPHGRPTVVRIPVEELNKKFGRS